MSENSTLERVSRLVAPILSDLRLELYDLEFRGGTLRITIDTPPGSDRGVDLDQIAFVTRMVSRDLDHDDPVPGRYTLEVSSPGLERRLRTPDHFVRAIGSEVTVKTRTEVDGERRFTGTLAAADDDGITIRTAADAADRRLTYDQIEKARTVFEWGPAPKPGGGRNQRKKASAR